jgi:hypothetical protein
MDLYRYTTNASRGAFHYVREVAGGMLIALCGRNTDTMRPLAELAAHTECKRCTAKRADLTTQAPTEAAPVEAVAAEQAEATLYRPAAPRSRGVGHHRRPGTSASYCGRTVEAAPSAAAMFTGECKPCAKAERADRVAAEQRAAAFSVAAPSITERAGVRYCTVGTGRRVHLSNNDDTLCGREVTEYTDGSAFVEGRELCAPCDRAAEERAYARALAAASPLAAAAVALAETVEQDDAETAEDVEAQQAAALVTEAEATAGTWRGEWIGPRVADTLFTLDTAPTEQGALFA